MSDDEIAQRVQRIIAEALKKPLAEVRPHASFVHDLQADSLGIVETIFAIEKEFDIKIPDDEAEKLRTVEDATRFIRKTLL
ncbi:MAG: acyl carrier protein [Alphaproteobacteria bacterium]|nr:acyl carrier protein [Alphaproteobacteria bacterium]